MRYSLRMAKVGPKAETIPLVTFFYRVFSGVSNLELTDLEGAKTPPLNGI